MATVTLEKGRELRGEGWSSALVLSVYGHQLMLPVVSAASELLSGGGLGPVTWKLQSSEAWAGCELQDGAGDKYSPTAEA